MKFSKGQKMRFRCHICNSVKNVKLVHAKNSLQKTASPSEAGGNVNKFVLQYKVGKHHRGTRQCDGSDMLQSMKYDGLLGLEF